MPSVGASGRTSNTDGSSTGFELSIFLRSVPSQLSEGARVATRMGSDCVGGIDEHTGVEPDSSGANEAARAVSGRCSAHRHT